MIIINLKVGRDVVNIVMLGCVGEVWGDFSLFLIVFGLILILL